VTGPGDAGEAGAALDAIAATARAMGREDLATRLTEAGERAKRPATVVCVVGEFKQGKSTLVNSLLGVNACPVDDDLATSAITVVSYAQELKVTVHRRTPQGGGVQADAIEPGAIAEWVTERGNPGNERGVERLDIGITNSLLADGLVLVDTPGMGSLGAGHAAATLAFLPFAQALVFASDALTEFNAVEVDFLRRARELCPNVVVALTKIDIAAHWRRIEALDRARLVEMGLADVPIVPVAAPVRASALRRVDRVLNERSGYPELIAQLTERVVAPAREQAMTSALVEADEVLGQLESPLAIELEAASRPEQLAAAIANGERAVARLEHLRGPGARWSQVMADRLADMSNDINYTFRGEMRRATRGVDEAVETLKTPSDWDALARRLQSDVAEAVTATFQRIADGGDATRQAVLDLLAEDSIDLPPLGGRDASVSVADLWSRRSIDAAGSRTGRGLSTTLTGLRGAQSGILMFGLLGHYLPAGAAALLMSNPVTISLGLAFGGMQLLDGHKRKIAQRRQQARMNARQFLDDVQFEVSNDISDTLRNLQRSLRDEFSDVLVGLQRTYATIIQQSKEAAQREQTTSVARAAQLTEQLEALHRLRQLARGGVRP
jgi:hypothetical protein